MEIKVCIFLPTIPELSLPQPSRLYSLSPPRSHNPHLSTRPCFTSGWPPARSVSTRGGAGRLVSRQAARHKWAHSQHSPNTSPRRLDRHQSTRLTFLAGPPPSLPPSRGGGWGCSPRPLPQTMRMRTLPATDCSQMLTAVVAVSVAGRHAPRLMLSYAAECVFNTSLLNDFLGWADLS